MFLGSVLENIIRGLLNIARELARSVQWLSAILPGQIEKAIITVFIGK